MGYLCLGMIIAINLVPDQGQERINVGGGKGCYRQGWMQENKAECCTKKQI